MPLGSRYCNCYISVIYSIFVDEHMENAAILVAMVMIAKQVLDSLGTAVPYWMLKRQNKHMRASFFASHNRVADNDTSWRNEPRVLDCTKPGLGNSRYGSPSSMV